MTLPNKICGEHLLISNPKVILKLILIACFTFLLSFNKIIAHQECLLESKLIDVGGYKLNFNIIAGNEPTILFESGGGNDSSVWQEVLKLICPKLGNEIITYDRASFGKSEPNPSQSPYDITQEVKALEIGLKALNINKKIIIVAHSYGGFLALLFAARNPENVAGIILIDANLSEFFTKIRVNKIMNEIAENKESTQKNNPSFFRLLVAFPSTVETMKKIKLPSSIPIIDIVAEKPPLKSEEDNAAWKHGHEKFTRMFNNRKMVLAVNAGHFIMIDDPELIAHEIFEMTSWFKSIKQN